MAFVVVFVLLCWASLAQATNYSTIVRSAENPVSERGLWTNGGAAGFTDVRTNIGLLYGTMPGTAPGNAQFADSTAVVLAGLWTGNQSAQAVVVNNTPGGQLGISEEVEIRLHTTIGATTITGYECLFSVRPAPEGQYAQIVKWNGPLASFTLLDARAMATQLVTGDVVGCRATGSGGTRRITISRNGVDLFFVLDSTYTAGSPGVGFYLHNTTGTNAQYGFSAFEATDGQIFNAADGNQPAVQAALTSAASSVTDSIVVIPAGTWTWTAKASYTGSIPIMILGRTVCRGGNRTDVTCTDNTKIIDAVDRPKPPDTAALDITVPATGNFRISGISMFGNGVSTTFTDNGTLRMGGTNQNVRIDNFHCENLRSQCFTSGGLAGLMDHTRWVMVDGTSDNAVRPNGAGASQGDPYWNQATANGTAGGWFYIEDSTFVNGIVNDVVKGGKQVFRKNTIHNSAFQTHPVGSQGRARGGRALEIYQNDIDGAPCTSGGGTCFNAHFHSAGTLEMWSNNAFSSWQHFITFHSMRRKNKLAPGGTYTQDPWPTGWGQCGTVESGTGNAQASSPMDQNSDIPSGYACLDDPGRGIGDLLTGSFPGVTNSTLGAAVWPRQALEPIHLLNNTWSGPLSYQSVNDTPSLTNNVDFYYECGPNNSSCPSSFTGAAGTGTGTLAAMPGSCVGKTAYLALDQGEWDSTHAGPDGKFFKCVGGVLVAGYGDNATGLPLVYPHPLNVGGGSGGAPDITPPAAPTNLRFSQAGTHDGL